MAGQNTTIQSISFGPYSIIRPVSPVATSNIGIIWAMGWRGTTYGMLKNINPFTARPGAEGQIVWFLAERYTVLVTQRGPNNNPSNYWGNSSGVAGIEDAYQVLQGLGCDSRVGLAGTSGGIPDLTQWGAQNVAKVRGIAPIMGATDLQHLRDTWIPVFGLDARADIDTAWGVTYPAALPAGAEPKGQASAFNGTVPAIVWIGSADTTVSVAGSQTWATNAGATLHIVPGAAHDDDLQNAVDKDELSNLFVT